MNKKFFFIFIFVFIVCIKLFISYKTFSVKEPLEVEKTIPQVETIPKIKPQIPVEQDFLQQKQVVNKPIPIKIPGTYKVLTGITPIHQTFNNCGPATLSMILSYNSVNVSQKVIGDEIRPWQNPKGDNDDKSTNFKEFSDIAIRYKLVPLYRVNGDINILKTLIENDIPVVARTWLKPNDEIGHYKIIKGYDENKKELIQDDSYFGPNIRLKYETFLEIWQPFNYEYFLVIKPEQKETALAIIGNTPDIGFASDSNESQEMWQMSLERNLKELKNDPENIYLRHNLVVNYYYLKEYEKAISEYEKIKDKLPFRMLWYQNEPIRAYQKAKKYNITINLIDQVLNNHNKAASELYIIKGQIYQEQGKIDLAKKEYELALKYNKNENLPNIFGTSN